MNKRKVIDLNCFKMQSTNQPYIIRFRLAIFFIGFGLALIWENLHYNLYKSFSTKMLESEFVFCALGDVLLIFLIYYITGKIFNNPLWILSFNRIKIFVTFGISVLFSVVAEKAALLMDFWEYKEQMPLIPYLKIGLSPFLAISILPLLSFYFASRFIRFLKA